MSNPTTITARPGTPFIDITREFDATPAQVFRAATDPALIARWLGPRSLSMDIEECDGRPGGTYRYVNRDADGTEYRFRGVFHTVAKNECLRVRGRSRPDQSGNGDLRRPRRPHPPAHPLRLPLRRGPRRHAGQRD
jgi:uncharacterized protein YndB with AHSA1/START domain